MILDINEIKIPKLFAKASPKKIKLQQEFLIIKDMENLKKL